MKSVQATPLFNALTGAFIAAAAGWLPPAVAQKVGAADIGGVVSGPKGPEAGVWVIAETASLSTGYAKVVVTDDQGRYLIPELPKAKYNVWVDRYNTLGLGANVPIINTNGGESLLAIVDGKVVDMRVPYPLGFFTKLVDGRIDDPNTGWKGRGVWTMSGTRTVFHNEGGTKNYPKVYKLQIRPDPLAN